MGGKGTYSIGQSPTFKFEAVGEIDGIKIIKPIDKSSSLKLPEESHTAGNSYVLLDRSGVFKQFRLYNENHEVILEIGYHIEPCLGKGKQLHAHVHEIPGVDGHRIAKKYVLTKDDPLFQKYKNLFIGIEI